MFAQSYITQKNLAPNIYYLLTIKTYAPLKNLKLKLNIIQQILQFLQITYNIYKLNRVCIIYYPGLYFVKLRTHVKFTFITIFKTFSIYSWFKLVTFLSIFLYIFHLVCMLYRYCMYTDVLSSMSFS